jgi:hypothetical protein
MEVELEENCCVPQVDLSVSLCGNNLRRIVRELLRAAVRNISDNYGVIVE